MGKPLKGHPSEADLTEYLMREAEPIAQAHDEFVLNKARELCYEACTNIFHTLPDYAPAKHHYYDDIMGGKWDETEHLKFFKRILEEAGL